MSASYALALPESRTRRPALYGTRAQLAAGNGDVEGYLALAGCDRRAGTASYALRIVNQSAHPLRARMTCARLRGEAVLAYPLDIHIAPFSISETLLPVRVADVGPYDRAIVQVAGEDVAFSLEAPAPQRKGARKRWIAAGASALAFTLISAFSAAAVTPRIGAIAAPERALAGTAIDVPYAFGGWATMRYALETPDGRQISAGLRTEHQGTLHFQVPAAAGRDVVLGVTVAGPFGKQRSAQRIAIAGAPPRAAKPARTQPPRIGEFVVATPVVHAGGKLQLAYVTNAPSGEIWLVDEAGRLWASAPMDTSGTATMTVPHGTSGRKLRALLRVRNGKAQALASVAFSVVPWEDDGANAAPARQSAAAMPVLNISSEAAAPGDTITVSIAGHHGDAQVSLTDASGNAIEQGDIGAGQSAVTLTAPGVTEATTYYVTASVRQGIGEQTLVKKLTVTPR